MLDIQTPMNEQHKQIMQEDFELSMKLLSWAHLNFQLQNLLYHKQECSNTLTQTLLSKIGYVGKDIQLMSTKEYEKLFTHEGFFSASQTGKRIAAFALKENGLNQHRFSTVEESITNAYEDIKQEEGESQLLDKSFVHCIDTLNVFKL